MNEPGIYAIHWRKVVNDVCVGEWKKLEWDGVPTLEGLKEWMAADSVWDFKKLERGGFNHRLWNYGMRLQFWVPDMSRKYLVVDEGVEV